MYFFLLKWIHCNATSDEAETKLPALLVTNKPIKLRCRIHHDLLREPYVIKKELPIKTGKLNRQRFFGVAVPCNNNTNNGSTIFTAFIGRHQEVPLVTMIAENRGFYFPPNKKTNQSPTLPTTTIRSKSTISTMSKNLGNGYTPLFFGVLILICILVLICLSLLIFFIISKSRKKPNINDDGQELRRDSNMNSSRIIDTSIVTNIGKNGT